jgi:hypothetical protein
MEDKKLKIEDLAKVSGGLSQFATAEDRARLEAINKKLKDDWENMCRRALSYNASHPECPIKMIPPKNPPYLVG